MEGWVNVVPRNRFPLMVPPKPMSYVSHPLPPYLRASLIMRRMHCQHVSYPIRVGLAPHCNIGGKGGHPGKEGPHFPLLGGFGRARRAGSISKCSANPSCQGVVLVSPQILVPGCAESVFPGLGQSCLLAERGR